MRTHIKIKDNLVFSSNDDKTKLVRSSDKELNLFKLALNGKVRHFKMNLIPTGIQYMHGYYNGTMQTETKKLNPRLSSNTYYSKLKDLRSEGYKTFTEYQAKFTGLKRVEDIPLFVIYNTNVDWQPLPMLANVYKESLVKFPVIAQPKYDGVRCLGLDSKLLSRGGIYYMQPHLEKEVRRLTELCNGVPDGELYIHGMPLSEISGKARKTMPDMFDEQLLEFHIYDYIASDNEAQWYRTDILRAVKEKHGHEFKYIKFSPYIVLNNDEEVTICHDRCVADGYEGCMIRDMRSPYAISFRVNSLLKKKAFLDDKFILIDVSMNGEKDYRSLTGTLLTDSNKQFKAKFKCSLDEAVNIYKSPPLGEYVNVKFLNWSTNKLPEKAQIIL